MHLFDTHKLADELKNNLLSDKEYVKYFLLYFVTQGIISELYSLFYTKNGFFIDSIELLTPVLIVQSVVNILAVFIGITLSYLSNKKGDNTNFINRYICLSIPIGIKVYALFSLIYFIYAFFFTEGDDLSTTWGDVIVLSVVEIFFYWRMVYHISYISNNSSAPRLRNKFNEVIGVGTLSILMLSTKIGFKTAGAAGKAAFTLFKSGGAVVSARKVGSVAMELEETSVFIKSSAKLLDDGEYLLSGKDYSTLFYKHPQLRDIVNKGNQSEFLLENPEIANDISLAFYKENPNYFVKEFSKNIILKNYPGALDDIVRKKVLMQTTTEAESIIKGSLRRLEQEGIDLSQLTTLETAKLEKQIADVFLQEISAVEKASNYKWGYKSGKLYVNGELGHFIFEQEIAITTIIKVIATGSVAIGGYNWKFKKFNRIKDCKDKSCVKESDLTE